MSKRLFQLLDEMNIEDGEKKTTLVEVGANFISADKVKGGARITMGMPESAIYDIMNEVKVPILLLVDKKEYLKRTEEQNKQK